MCPRLVEEILCASSVSLLQREFSLVPELVCWCAMNVWSVDCEQSRDLPRWPWLAASRCFLGSCGCKLALWQAGPCPLPPHDNPHFPSALPRLIPDPTHIHHDHIMTSGWATRSHTFTWDAARSLKKTKNYCLSTVVSDRGARRELWPARCHSYLTVI